MSRLIDADELKKVFMRHSVISKGSILTASILISDVIDYINIAPTIEPVKGKWLYEWYKGMHPVGYKRPKFKCSVCEGWSIVESKFCPNCGADMRED